MNRIILLILILSSCFHSKDYYNSKEYKSRERIKQSDKMFKETHKVRNRCSRGLKNRSRNRNKRKRRIYYS